MRTTGNSSGGINVKLGTNDTVFHGLMHTICKLYK